MTLSSFLKRLEMELKKIEIELMTKRALDFMEQGFRPRGMRVDTEMS